MPLIPRSLLVTVLLAAAGCAHQVQYLAVDGGHLEYQVVGRGEPVLLIHGSIFAGAFKPILHEPALSGFRLITYHRRGFAGSSRVRAPFTIPNHAADALVLLDGLGVRRAHIVGHSYGGNIALQLASDHPERVLSLVLLEPALFQPSPALEAMGGDIGVAIEMHAKGNDRGAIQQFATAVIGPEPLSTTDERLGAGAVDQAVADAPTFFEVDAPALGEWKFTLENAAALRVPTLLVVGGDSREPFKEAVAALKRAIAGSEQLVVPQTNHALQIANPRPVAEGIASFLRRNRELR